MSKVKYDLQTANVLKMLQENFNVSVIDLVKRDSLKYVVNTDNHDNLMLILKKVLAVGLSSFILCLMLRTLFSIQKK